MPPKRMTANPVRPARYRPGKPIAPEETSDTSGSEESGSESESEPERAPLPKPVYKKKVSAAAVAAAPTLKDVDLTKRFDEAKKAEEARLAAEAAAAKKKEDDDDEYTTDESSGSDEEDDDEEEAVGADYEAADEGGAARKVQLRPTFLPKAKRAAIPAAGSADTDEARKRAAEEARQREEAAELLEHHLKRDAEARAAGRRGWNDDEDAGEAVADTDGADAAAERAAWKLRELRRIKREREALAAIEAERAEIERRREMDPAQREKEDLEYVREQRKEKMDARGKMGFMQKFYHKGAFYQEEDILKRDYATAEVEDAARNREVLPKYMQVRGDEVGKRGRTRWTHLTAEDTSLQAGGSPWFDKKGGNRFPPPGGMGGDQRFMADRPVAREGGFNRDERRGERGMASGDAVNNKVGEGGIDAGPEGKEEGGRSNDRGGKERGSRWDERESSRPRAYNNDRRPRDDGDRRPRDDDRRPRDDDRRSGYDGPRHNRREDDDGQRPSGGAARDREHHDRGGREDDRERKRRHSPRSRDQEGDKRRRRDASPAR